MPCARPYSTVLNCPLRPMRRKLTRFWNGEHDQRSRKLGARGTTPPESWSRPLTGRRRQELHGGNTGSGVIEEGRKGPRLHNAIAHHLGIAQNMGMKSSLPPVLVHLPGVTSKIVDALRRHARVVETSSRSQLLALLSARSTGEAVAWRAVVLATDGSFQEDLPFLARVAEALP